MTSRNRILKMNPAILVLASFLFLITAGALLLKLPYSTVSGSISWIDAYFTATSAVCVTGLVVVDTGSYFSLFGQWVILALIQLGGLGLMSISVLLFKLVGRGISIRHRMALQDTFSHTPRGDIFSLIKSIVLFTLLSEIAGAVVLTIHWSREYPVFQAAYKGLFHSVSAFCNAGFALYPDSMMQYRGSFLLNAAICSLIVVGGIGFTVLYDLQCWARLRKKQRFKLSVQTKTVLATTLILIVAGAVMFAFLEQFPGHEKQSLGVRILTPLFQSITCRTAGFNTADIASLKDATLAMMIFLMFFGASPGSCGGGVKTTTLALISMFTLSRLRQKKSVNMFKKTIPEETVKRSVSLVLSSIGIISVVFFSIMVGNAMSGSHQEAHGAFLKYLFETVSAFGTVGLSMGVTPELNLWGKSMIIIMMIIGRVGVLTFSYIIVGTISSKSVEYSEENMMIG